MVHFLLTLLIGVWFCVSAMGLGIIAFTSDDELEGRSRSGIVLALLFWPLAIAFILFKEILVALIQKFRFYRVLWGIRLKYYVLRNRFSPFKKPPSV